MAQIAEDLLLLLLDNASAQPGLDRQRRRRVLGAAILLDLAWACRVRPAVHGEPVETGRLVALTGSGPLDPVTGPALQLLSKRPLRPASAIAKLSRHAEEALVAHLECSGQIRRIPLPSKGFKKATAYPLVSRDRVGPARSALLSALFDRRPPTPPTAAIISLLHATDGLGALLSLNDRGWRWVHARAGEIALGSWVDESPTALPEVNLAVTVSALRPALGS
ncbi:GPP34 family phosphoprotein [Mycobacterium sp. ITM-2016-00316]|uniref:GOLPH3/VPS74 family protein n=1 Tax=Mycobacterium sp. ITM-2016-00316 TaxID=2099695 RepID=UPI000CF86360|nr:GPP34 family phosphoprotein [Mycobacterium sp. ITM-2016-00316]WNG80865.1 GPP34 family phosphoprotein [Mycobacterium sp. ITM-2016-00316]